MPPPPDTNDAVPRGAFRHARAHTLPEARRITRESGRDLRTLVGRYVRRHLPPRREPPPPPEEPPRTRSHERILPWLRLVPLTLALLFALSFAWDFPGLVLPGTTIPLDGLLRTLAVSGLIGFVTNWLAITMLFHPRRRRPLFGQGLIPAQRERVIYRLARAVSEELINEDLIKQRIEESRIIPRYRALFVDVTRGVIEDPDFRRDVKALAADYVDSVLASEEVRRRLVEFTIAKVEAHADRGVGGLALRAYRFFNEDDFQRRVDEAVREIPASLDSALDELDGLLDRVPAQVERHAHEIEDWATRSVLGFVENIDIYRIVADNMRAYDEQKLEDLVKRTSNEQLNYIKYLGGVLGFFGGLVIWQPLLALGAFALLGLLLYAVDAALLQSKRA